MILEKLRKDHYDVAFLRHRNCIYFSYTKIGAPFPASAVIKLLQNVFETVQDRSFFILRNRIYATEAFSERASGMVKVVGKRVTFGFSGELGDETQDLDWIECGRSEETDFFSRHLESEIQISWPLLTSHAQAFSFLEQRLSMNRFRSEALHDLHRRVAAVLVDERGAILESALNTSAINKTLHAEINLIQNFLRRSGTAWPEGYRFYVTHKPCKMCAGMIHDLSENVQIYYLNEEKGSHSRSTVLDRGKRQIHWAPLGCLNRPE